MFGIQALITLIVSSLGFRGTCILMPAAQDHYCGLHVDQLCTSISEGYIKRKMIGTNMLHVTKFAILMPRADCIELFTFACPMWGTFKYIRKELCCSWPGTKNVAPLIPFAKNQGTWI